MDKNTPPKATITALIRRGLTNRFTFDAVSISREGDIVGTYYTPGYDDIAVKMGNVSEFSFERTDSMNVRLLRNGYNVFTFPYDV